MAALVMVCILGSHIVVDCVSVSGAIREGTDRQQRVIHLLIDPVGLSATIDVVPRQVTFCVVIPIEVDYAVVHLQLKPGGCSRNLIHDYRVLFACVCRLCRYG